MSLIAAVLIAIYFPAFFMLWIGIAIIGAIIIFIKGY
jgi:hypothetical protein